MHMTNSYLNDTEAQDWCDQRGIDRFDAIDPLLQPKLLLQSSEWIDRQFRFAGTKASPQQIRAWPREGVRDAEGEIISGIPDMVKAAMIELAILLAEDTEAAEQALGLTPAVSQQKAGGIEIRYDNKGKSKHSNTGKIALMLAPLLRKSGDVKVVRG
jgi:hypothetical protein